MKARISRVESAVSLFVLVAGVVSPSFGRNFPAKPSGGVRAGIPEQGVYLMAPHGQRVAAPGSLTTPFYGTSSYNAGSVLGAASTGPASESSPRSLQSRFGAGESIDRLVPDASSVLPSMAQKDQRLLAVHMGTETVYVSFKSDAERKQYVADLKRNLATAGLGVESRTRTGEQPETKAAGPVAVEH